MLFSFLSLILSKFLRVGAAFVAVEGFGNLIYWRYRTHEGNKLLFQIGRLVRGALGLLYTILFSLGWRPL